MTEYVSLDLLSLGFLVLNTTGSLFVLSLILTNQRLVCFVACFLLQIIISSMDCF